jgi:hypothetical protein
MEVLLGLLPLHVIIEAEAQTGIYRLLCNHQWRPKSTNYSHAETSQDMDHKPILLMGTDQMIPRYAYHKPFKVQLLNNQEWQNRINPHKKGGLAGIQTDPRPTKALELGCTNGAGKRGIASLLGSTPRYSRQKYMPLRLA